jgi:hypothetical protein
VITYDQKNISTAIETKFLGLIVDDTLFWSPHIHYIIKELSVACYAIRNIKYTVTAETLRLIYFAHVHSMISYGIIFWGSASEAQKVFVMQKRILRIMKNMRPRDSCQEIFKRMKIMTLYSQDIYALFLFVIDNKNLFENSELYVYKTRFCKNLHMPSVNLAKFNSGAFIPGIRVFNHLTQSIKRQLDNEKGFKSILKRFLCHHAVYSMNEFYQFTES